MFKEITREELHAEYIKRGLTEEEATLACDNVEKQNDSYTISSSSSNLWAAFCWYKTEQGSKYWRNIADRAGMSFDE